MIEYFSSQYGAKSSIILLYTRNILFYIWYVKKYYTVMQKIIQGGVSIDTRVSTKQRTLFIEP